MARASRPPGFDMTYRPARRFSVRPGRPLPSFVYLGLALARRRVGADAERSPPVERALRLAGRSRHDDRELEDARLAAALSASQRCCARACAACASAATASSFATSSARLAPRAALQVGADRPHRPGPAGSDCGRPVGWHARLLAASQRSRGLSAALEKVAAARAIPVRGGAGLDEIPERPSSTSRKTDGRAAGVWGRTAGTCAAVPRRAA